MTAEPARAILDVEKIDVVADRGYFRDRGYRGLREGGAPFHMCRGPSVDHRSARASFARTSFATTPNRTPIPARPDMKLKPIREGRLRDMKKIDYANAAACRECPLRPRCTNNFRAVSRLEGEDALDRMAERLKARPEILDRRRETVEHPFGTIQAMDQPGRVPHARSQQGPRGVQPDGARLQLAAGDQHPRHGEADGGGRGLKAVKSR